MAHITSWFYRRAQWAFVLGFAACSLSVVQATTYQFSSAPITIGLPDALAASGVTSYNIFGETWTTTGVFVSGPISTGGTRTLTQYSINWQTGTQTQALIERIYIQVLTPSSSPYFGQKYYVAWQANYVVGTTQDPTKQGWTGGSGVPGAGGYVGALGSQVAENIYGLTVDASGAVTGAITGYEATPIITNSTTSSIMYTLQQTNTVGGGNYPNQTFVLAPGASTQLDLRDGGANAYTVSHSVYSTTPDGGAEVVATVTDATGVLGPRGNFTISGSNPQVVEQTSGSAFAAQEAAQTAATNVNQTGAGTASPTNADQLALTQTMDNHIDRTTAQVLANGQTAHTDAQAIASGIASNAQAIAASATSLGGVSTAIGSAATTAHTDAAGLLASMNGVATSEGTAATTEAGMKSDLDAIATDLAPSAAGTTGTDTGVLAATAMGSGFLSSGQTSTLSGVIGKVETIYNDVLSLSGAFGSGILTGQAALTYTFTIMSYVVTIDTSQWSTVFALVRALMLTGVGIYCVISMIAIVRSAWTNV